MKYLTLNNLKSSLQRLMTFNDSTFIKQGTIEDLLSYGVRWDSSTSSSVDCTRVGNMKLHKTLPIQNSLKGCLFKDGAINYYLYENDWTKKSDGITASVLDGTDGDIMVHHMTFYIKGFSDGTAREIRISTIKIDDTWTEVLEGVISAYRATIDRTNNKLGCVINTTTQYRGGNNSSDYDSYLETDANRTHLGKSVSNISRATARTYARNNNLELLDYEAYKNIIYWLPVIEYASFNIQKAYNSTLTSEGYHQGGLGDGISTWDWSSWSSYNGNCSLVPCGYTNEFGNFSGVKDITCGSKTMSVPRYRGIENIFGDIWTNVDGIISKKNVANGDRFTYVTSDPSKYSDSDYSSMELRGTTPDYNESWIKEFVIGDKADIIPLSVGGSGTTYKADYSWNNQDLSNHTVLFGGNADGGSSCGLGCFNARDGVGSAFANVGFRVYKRLK